MRVSMKYAGIPTPCETFAYGEVEDYTVAISCASAGSNFSYEYIGNVTVGSFSKTSGGSSYSDYTTDIIPVVAGNNSVTLTPVFPGSVYVEYWSIWVDFNKDGDFTDSGEQLFAPAGSTSVVSGSITIPSTFTRSTRMRITMKYAAAPVPCETFSYGEVEDYTVMMGSAKLEINEPNITEFNIYPNPANKILYVQSTETKTDMSIYNALGSLMMKKQINNSIEEIDISNFANGMYTICITKNNQVQVKKFIKN
jgi:hypothetical protein